jgi:hypothetical protein
MPAELVSPHTGALEKRQGYPCPSLQPKDKLVEEQIWPTRSLTAL